MDVDHKWIQEQLAISKKQLAYAPPHTIKAVKLFVERTSRARKEKP